MNGFSLHIEPPSYVVGAQKNHLKEMVLLSLHKICVD